LTRIQSVTVVGAGAIGGYVAARLHLAGTRVVTVCDRNREHLATIRSSGLRVSGEADLLAHPQAVEPQELPDGLETVLLAVKTGATVSALDALAPRLAPDGFVVSLQNGLQEYLIAERIGSQRTVGAFLTFGGHYVAPGEVAYGGPGSLRLGELDGASSQRLAELVRVLSLVHPAEPTSNIFGFLWSKTAVNAFYFATALAGVDVQDVIRSRRHRSALDQLVAEVARVAQAEGVRCEDVDGFSPRAFEGGDQAGITASWEAQLGYWARHGQRRTGIWRDLSVHRRETEVTGILQPVKERALERGIQVPLLTKVLAMVKEAESGKRSLDLCNLDDLAALAESR
jgi:2-dehydropantoate 2-reductase